MQSLSTFENLSVFFQYSITYMLQPMNLVIMFGSMIIGIIFGVLPGLSATIAIALFASITYGASLDMALTVLLGVYVGAIYGGSISAILINIPGTGCNAPPAWTGIRWRSKERLVLPIPWPDRLP